ncbi:MAG: dihydrofolate reductase [Candidatus Kerfeldbacteria bacterium]|nr:dihydrofolate reductase [Candidatus Kerfeldbacteria bacterium]
MIKFSIIAAIDKKNGLGKAGKLAWHFKGDLEHFKDITTRPVAPGKQNAVIMGSVTWYSLPESVRPLADRTNIVLNFARDIDLPAGVLLSTSLDEAIAKAAELPKVGEIFIIGGASVYKQAISHPKCDKLYLTQIEAEFDCDTFFPIVDKAIFKETSVSDWVEEKGVKYRFIEYQKI